MVLGELSKFLTIWGSFSVKWGQKHHLAESVFSCRKVVLTGLIVPDVYKSIRTCSCETFDFPTLILLQCLIELFHKLDGATLLFKKNKELIITEDLANGSAERIIVYFLNYWFHWTTGSIWSILLRILSEACRLRLWAGTHQLWGGVQVQLIHLPLHPFIGTGKLL